MGKDTTDEDEDDPTETDVDLDSSLIAEMITVTRTGDEPLTATASSASGADTEPRTLEPQLLVRGLVPSYPHVPGSVEAPRTEDASTRRGDDDDGDDKTTRSIDARLLEAYGSGQSVERAGAHRSTQPVATLRSAVITPSEPFRVTAVHISAMPGSSGAQPTPRRAAPMPAAGRPPGSDPDLGEPTQKREPFLIAEENASAPDDVDDETATDAMQARRVDTIDVEQGEEDEEDEEEDETRTRQDVGGVIASLPAVARDLVGLDEARQASRAAPASSASVPAAAPAGQSGPGTPGATIRMLFNASLGAVTIDPALRDTVLRDTVPPPQRQSAPPAFPAPGPPLALVADPQLQQAHGRVPPPPATTVRRPPTPRFDPLAKPKRHRGRKLFYFLLLCAAFAGGFRYRYRITPWVMKHLPASWRPSPPSEPSAPIMVTPVPSPAPNPSASASASASAPSSLDASAPLDASADGSASTSASAAASSSSSHAPKKRPKK